ncbi:type VII secretion-associated serine protease mycosin [Actinocatenispora sera]|uniref:type VII secretion-associated serine protease mycosin n=1 Tax=Actinocatenispora sera TaxID=390989 RepID=UPI00340AB9AD
MLARPRWMRRAGASRPVALLVAACVAALIGTFAPSAPALAEDQCAQPGKSAKGVSWAQLALDPQSVWPFTTGAGVLVGVVDTGVDASNAQLDGHVGTGTSFLKGGGDGDTDCVGHGTGMAGVIVAQQSDSVGFYGIAPGAKVLPVAVTKQIDDTTQSDDGTPDPATVAKGIRYAVDHGASVVNVSIVVHTDDSALKSAVAYALDKGRVVVAAVGVEASEPKKKTPYPAAYPGVLGVGAVGPDETLQEGSATGSYVDLVAPGAGVTTTARKKGLTTASGSDVAAAEVSATVALIRARWPQLGPEQIERRLKATASPTPGGPNSHEYGAGMVNPHRAITETMSEHSPAALPGYQRARRSAADIERGRVWAGSSRMALLIAALSVLAGLVVVGAAVAIPRGRRRRWSVRLATPPRDSPEDDLPAPPVELFDKMP